MTGWPELLAEANDGDHRSMQRIAVVTPGSDQRSIILYGALLILSLFKLYLVAGQDIIAMPYDTYSYLWMSDAWYWGNRYSFARRPGFPLFLGLASNTGLPLRLVFELLYLGASARLAAATVRLGFPQWSAMLGFFLTIMLPYTFVWLSFAYVECMLAPVLIWMSAEFVYVMTERGRRRRIHSLIFSLLIVLAWFSRSESILILGAAAGAILVLLAGASVRRLPFKVACALCARLFLPPAIALAVASLAVALLNQAYFGRLTTTEDLRAPAFVRAYDDLQDIRSSTRIRYVPFARDQMAIAAQVSPAFKEIYGSLQGDIGDTYRRIAKNEAGVDNEIAGGWLVWALREAVDRAGYHDARAQDAFYRRMAEELEAAAHAGKIEMIHFPMALVDPKIDVWGPFLPRSLVTTANRLVPNHPLSAPTQGVATPEIVREFDLRANRRAALVRPDAPDPRAARAVRALRILGQGYRPVMFGLVVLGLLLFLLGGWRRLTLPIASLFAFMLVPIIGRIGIVALLDASSYPTIGIDRYVLPASAVFPFIVVCLLALRFRRRSDTTVV
jgi:hypothetical protein